MKWAIIVHGGLKAFSPGLIDACREGSVAALTAGERILAEGGSGLDAAEAAVRSFEDNAIFNAGLGSALNRDGEVEMDAAIMDGRSLRCGAVAALRQVANPISVARRVMESPAVLLAGEGARRFVEEQCPELSSSQSMVTEEAYAAWKARDGGTVGASKDTVGCVALDSEGALSAAVSTGGLSGKLPGRVGDSPLVGCGLYADGAGATALTGDGESIIRGALASRILQRLHAGVHPQEAAEEALRFFTSHLPGEAGCIVLDAKGRVGWTHNSPNMACAYMTSESRIARVFTRKEKVDD